MLKKKFLLGVGVTNVTEEEILEYILQSLKKSGQKYYIVTPNPEIIVLAQKNPQFKTILNDARLALCDGIGLFWAGKFLGKNFKQRITGVDFLENLGKAVSKQPITVGFLGGEEKIAERTAECLTKKYPGLKVVFAAPEWPEARGPAAPSSHPTSSKKSSSASWRTVGFRRALDGTPSGRVTPRFHSQLVIDILFVAFGTPKQEEWMAKNIGKVPVRVMIGVGGAFDFISGNVPRAPVFVRTLGFEWFYRLIRQPWRLKRQLALLEFIWLILKEKMIF